MSATPLNQTLDSGVGAAMSDNEEFTYTGSVATDRLMYAFWGIRITIYSRIIGDALRYRYPEDYAVGSLYYFFFAFGVYFVLIAWVFISGYWMSLLYTYYISTEIKLHNTKRVRIFCYMLSVLYFIWMAVVQIICLFQDQTLLEAIGFFVFIIAFATMQAFNGIKFSNAMKESQKKSKMKHFDRNIYTTRVLVGTGITGVIIIVIHDIIFNFVLDKKYIYFPASTFITMFVDVGQMVVVLFILGGGTFKNYLLLRRAHNTISANSDNSTNEIDLSKGQSSSQASRMNSQFASRELNSRTIEVYDTQTKAPSTPSSPLATSPSIPTIDLNEEDISTTPNDIEQGCGDDNNNNNDYCSEQVQDI
ncbi:hypothetical protein DFA_08531 [Cavenderia fasciculata]|uniref:Uncharacterized protein n=1 Tax=Cavenderia fasciculata TaxID=261658 RepID=F4Q2X1_CACFS|nr:uncharacterized protein DFA_08531 [Cavenderia fasciculata]EGG17535.1 hypothetical protein DFA_08531 [Cavenderia fasciculata]|eukprot:XP_004356019.1 hypothetical protein DFA_08531 [Cavenderia fasciculata]